MTSVILCQYQSHDHFLLAFDYSWYMLSIWYGWNCGKQRRADGFCIRWALQITMFQRVIVYFDGLPSALEGRQRRLYGSNGDIGCCGSLIIHCQTSRICVFLCSTAVGWCAHELLFDSFWTCAVAFFHRINCSDILLIIIGLLPCRWWSCLGRKERHIDNDEFRKKSHFWTPPSLTDSMG
jgi:hypothetical protein